MISRLKKIKDSFLDDNRSKNILENRYVFEDLSLLRKYIIMPYILENAIEFIPKNVAPNILTLLGLFSILINHICLTLLDKNLQGNRIVSFCSAIFLFLSYLFDNLDGMHARRIKNGSALGQIFDHTVDSICINFIFLFLISSLGLGKSKTALILILCSQICFVMPTIEEKYTGKFSLGMINATCEGLMFFIIIHVISCIWGRNMIKKYTANKKGKKMLRMISVVFTLFFILSHMLQFIRMITLELIYEISIIISLIFNSYYLFYKDILDFYEIFFIGTLIFSNFLMKLLDSHISKKFPLPMVSYLLYFTLILFKNIKIFKYIVLLITLSEYIWGVISLVKFYEKVLGISWYKVK